MRRRLPIAAATVTAVATLTAGFLDRHARRGILRDVENHAPRAEARSLEVIRCDDGVCRIRMPKGGVRILYLTDLHLTAGYFTRRKDRSALRDISALVRSARPDLVVLGGDFISPIFWRSFTRDSRMQAKAVGHLMETLGIPWSFLPGNHEQDGHMPLDEVVGVMTSFHGCIHSAAPDTEGYNTCLSFCDGAGRTRHSFFLMDTHRRQGRRWDTVKARQIAWYRRTVEREGGASTVFCHIPPIAFEEAHRRWREGEGELLFGKGRKRGNLKERGFYSAMKACGTQLVLCGHHHFNSWAIRNKDGIVLAYNPSMDHSVYLRSHRKIDHLGGTLLTVREDGSLILRQYLRCAGKEFRYFPTKDGKIEFSAQKKS